MMEVREGGEVGGVGGEGIDEAFQRERKFKERREKREERREKREERREKREERREKREERREKREERRKKQEVRPIVRLRPYWSPLRYEWGVSGGADGLGTSSLSDEAGLSLLPSSRWPFEMMRLRLVPTKSMKADVLSPLLFLCVELSNILCSGWFSVEIALPLLHLLLNTRHCLPLRPLSNPSPLLLLLLIRTSSSRRSPS
jgi:hypothetical protein